MATKKHVRRRQKLRRHQYEEVWVDAEGKEVEPPPDVERKKREKDEPRRDARGSRGTREIPPPSLRRALRRAALFTPFMFIVMWIAQPNAAIEVRVGVALFYSLLFIPFIYLADTIAYRVSTRRARRDAAAKGR